MSERAIVLIDGENLVLRYQEMLESKFKPVPKTIHEKDIIVWHNKILEVFNFELMRVSYYTTFVGDIKSLEEMKEKISLIFYEFGYPKKNEFGSGTINPHVFKKERRSQKTKSVDINVTIDALRHTYNNNIDIVYLLSGDGDYLPLIEEIMHQGKRVWVGAFSSGCHPALKYSADDFIDLDKIFFEGKANNVKD